MLTVAYLSQEFPSLTTTFVYREVLALRRLGLTIRPISVWRPLPESLSAEARSLVDETFYLLPLDWREGLHLHLRYLARSPGRYLRALAEAVLFNREPLRNRFRSLGHFWYAVKAVAEIERCGADHLHADFAHNPATVALVTARLTGKPFSFAAHAHDIFAQPILLREKLAAAAFVTPISEYNRVHLAHLLPAGSERDKLHVIHCGLEMSQFELNGHRTAKSRRVILGVGRLVEKKGFAVLIAACQRLAARGCEAECWIVGGGPQRAELQAQIERLGLKAWVQLFGPQPQERVLALMRDADVFALPCVSAADGDQDGIPVVLMEAMALHLPVVSTALSGIPELITDGVNGLLVPERDADALAGAIATLLTQPALAQRLAEGGRLTVERDFNVEQSARQMAALLAAHAKGALA